MRTTGILQILALVLAQSAAAQAVRDSAGVRVVSNSAPAWTAAQALRLSQRPSLIIGNRPEDAYTLSRVRGACRLADGRIVVADGSTMELRIYDSAGTYIRSISRAGDGPGEFRQLGRLVHLRGDTLAAFDGMRGVSFFAGTGTFLGRTTPVTVSGPRPMPSMALAVFGDGSRVMVTSPDPLPRTRGARWIESQAPILIDRNNEILRQLDTLPMFMAAMDDYPRPPWFAAELAFANNDTAFFYGFGNEYRIRVYSANGRLRQIISRDWTPVKVTRADIETYVVEWGKRWIRSTGAEAERAHQDLRDDPYATEVPAFAQLIADRAGRLWARAAHLADVPGSGSFSATPLRPSMWSVFDGAGRWLGDVTMPARFLPYEIGSDYVLGVSRDADGLETVVLYGLATRATG